MKTLFTLITLLVISTNVYCQFNNDSTANAVIRDSLGTEQLTPLSATTSTGETFISWFDSYNSNYELRMQLLDRSGNKLWPDSGLVISNFPQSSALYRYDLQVDNEDNAVVAFQDTRLGDLNIVAYKISQAGSFLWSSSGVQLTDSGAQGLSPVIGITASNNVIIAWNADLNNSKWISFQKISPTGTILWSKRIFDNTNNSKYSRPSMTYSGIDNFLMMYVEEVGTFPSLTSTLFANLYDTDGNTIWTNPVQVSTKTIPFFTFPKIISDHQDGFFIAFNTSNPVNLSLNDVYAQHVYANGSLWSASGTELSSSTTEHKSFGGICYNSTNNSLYTCMQILDAGQGNSGIALQALDTNGNVLLGNNGVILKNIDPVYYNPHAIVDAGNGLIIVYTSGSFGAEQIASLKTDYNGTYVWGFDPSISVFLSNKSNLSAGLFKNDQSIIVWQDDRLDEGIYVQNLNGDGSLGIITYTNEIQNEATLVLYPNPSERPVLLLQTLKSEIAEVSIFNSQGQKCFAKSLFLKAGKNEIYPGDMNLSPGIYFIQIITNSFRAGINWIKPFEK